MEKEKKQFFIYSCIFFALNLLNAFVLTSNFYCHNLSWYHYNLVTFLNCFMGNFCSLCVWYGFSYILFKTYKSREIFMIVFSFFINLYIYAAMIYFNYYGMMFSLHNLTIFFNGDSGGTGNFIMESLPLLLKGSNLLAFVPFVTCLVLFFFFRGKKKNIEVLPIGFRNHAKKGTIFLLVGILGVLISMSSYDVAMKQNQITDYDTLQGYQTMGVYNYYFYELYQITFEKNSDTLSEKDTKEALSKYSKGVEKYSIVDGQLYERSEYENSLENKNLLLIQVESFSNFNIGLQILDNGTWKEVTPFLNSLTENANYFNNFYTAVGIGNTADAEFSTMTGLYSTGKNVSVYDFPYTGYDTLPKEFKDKGYQTFSVHANIGTFYNRNTIHTNVYGFDEHLDSTKLNTTGESNYLIHGYLNDEAMLKQTVNKMYSINETGNNVFAFAITISNHIPYIIEDNLYKDCNKLFESNTEILDVYKNYLEHVHYTDYALKTCFDELERLGMLDNTVVMLYGDHGSGINIIDEIDEKPTYFKNEMNPIRVPSNMKEKYLYKRQFNVQIPCIIYESSNILPTGIHSYVRGEVDIKETIDSLFGLDTNYVFGTDLFSNFSSMAYNPKNSDIFINGMMISGQSIDSMIYQTGYYYDDTRIYSLVNSYKKIRIEKESFLRRKIFK